MATTNHERVGKALDLLKRGLSPFVERELKNAYQDGASARIEQFIGGDRLQAKNRLPTGMSRRSSSSSGNPGMMSFARPSGTRKEAS